MSHDKALIFDLGNVVLKSHLIMPSSIGRRRQTPIFNRSETTISLTNIMIVSRNQITPNEFKDHLMENSNKLEGDFEQVGIRFTTSDSGHRNFAELKKSYRLIALTNTNAFITRLGNEIRQDAGEFEQVFIAPHEHRKPEPGVSIVLDYLQCRPQTWFFDDHPQMSPPPKWASMPC